MKKIIFYTLFLLSFAFFFSLAVSADVTPPNSHPVSRCVKVVNLNEFPDVVLIGYYTGPMLEKYKSYQIKNNECWDKGYKFNSLRIYWNTKNKANSIESNKLLLSDVEPYGGYVGKNNPLIKEYVEYSIAGFSGKKLVLYKSKQTSEYNDGTPRKIETFASPLKHIIIKQDPISTKRGFWSVIICFFRRLFGASC